MTTWQRCDVCGRIRHNKAAVSLLQQLLPLQQCYKITRITSLSSSSLSGCDQSLVWHFTAHQSAEDQTSSSAVAEKPTDACARRCCAVKSCPLVNDCDLLAGCCDSQSFTRGQLFGLIFRLLPTPQPIWRPQWRISSSYLVHSWYGKTRMAGLQSCKRCTMIDSVVWVQYINVTDTQTATLP